MDCDCKTYTVSRIREDASCSAPLLGGGLTVNSCAHLCGTEVLYTKCRETVADCACFSGGQRLQDAPLSFRNKFVTCIWEPAEVAKVV